MKKNYITPTLYVVTIKKPTLMAGSGFGANAQGNPGFSNYPISGSRRDLWIDDFDDDMWEDE